MDWTLAIERNRKALQLIVVALYALAGLVEGVVVATLPRSVYRVVLRVLRPAESALRRLIFIAARRLVLKPRPARPAPVGLCARTDAKRISTFQLIDPLKHFAPIAQEPASAEDTDFTEVWHDDEDDLEDEDNDYAAALPRISVPGLYDPTFFPTPPALFLNDEINAAHLCQRLAALKRALENLPRQARRLARWQAKRTAALRDMKAFKPLRLSPFRPGFPPRHRLSIRPGGRHEVDQILKECHALALDLRDRPDTS
jgi:hypothetical protein